MRRIEVVEVLLGGLGTEVWVGTRVQTKLAGTYKWYFVILWIQIKWWGHSNPNCYNYICLNFLYILSFCVPLCILWGVVGRKEGGSSECPLMLACAHSCLCGYLCPCTCLHPCSCLNHCALLCLSPSTLEGVVGRIEGGSCVKNGSECPLIPACAHSYPCADLHPCAHSHSLVPLQLAILKQNHRI